MNTKTQSAINRIAERARVRFTAWIDAARSQTVQAAGRVRDGKKPVQKLSKLGQKLTTVSHRTTTRVLEQQTRMVEHQIDAIAGRLKKAAKADNIVELVREQVRLVPAETSQFVTDARATLAIVTEAGGEVRDIIAGSVSDLRGKKTTVKKTAKKAPKKAAKKTAKKAAAKAKPAKTASSTTAPKTDAEPKAA